MLYYVKTTNQHVRRIAGNLRSADLQEMNALDPIGSIRERLFTAVATSVECYTAMIDGIPVGLFGLYPMHKHDIGIWALGTNLMTSRRFEFLNTANEVLSDWMHRYGDLGGYIWEGNTVHRAWLAWLGASFEDPITVPDTGQLFRRFKLCANQ